MLAGMPESKVLMGNAGSLSLRTLVNQKVTPKSE